MLLKSILAWLKALVPLLILVFLASYALHWMLARPVGQVSIFGEVRHLDQWALQQRALPWLAEPFWRVDLEGLRQDLEQDPWLAKVEITRRWPDRIDVHLLEHQPWARWNQDGVLNEQGEPFFPAFPDQLGLSRHFFSHPEHLVQVLEFYHLLKKPLAERQLTLTQVHLEPRGAWRFKFEEGITLLLGRDNIEKRTNRFLWVWSHWSEEQRAQVRKIDARYPNGLSVAWILTED